MLFKQQWSTLSIGRNLKKKKEKKRKKRKKERKKEEEILIPNKI